ncbi:MULTISPECIES: hypothetical protein [Glycomyces]|uniref:Uncharacterized protein n=2 Tax=Glycomyces TaxID=58113 RepID=A0ABU2AHY9_9ACTN|nr:hypothetical protein [Glycomyces lechevalierae]MDR7336794.1 hypothetical protein [Glycomyces lechevalierae]
MARSEARIKCRIWDDDDFLALDGPEKLVYLFVISQPDLTHNGVLPLRLKRWAKKLKFTVAQLEKVLLNLETARFIVVDHDEEELFVRSFLRNDEVYKQPKVMLSSMRQLGEISSALIRREVAREIARVLHEGLPGENTRPTLLKMLGILGGTPSEVKPQVNTLSDTLPHTHPDTEPNEYAEGFPVPNPMPTGVGVGVGDEVQVVGTYSSSPSGEAEEDTPNEEHEPASGDTSAQDSKKSAKPKTERGTRVPDGFTFTTEMQAWAKAKTPLVADDLSYHTEMFVDYWLGRTDKLAVKRDWIAAWRNWLRKANKDLEEKTERRSNPQGPKSTAPERIDDSEKCEHRRRASTCGLCRTEQMGANHAA